MEREAGLMGEYEYDRPLLADNEQSWEPGARFTTVNNTYASVVQTYDSKSLLCQ